MDTTTGSDLATPGPPPAPRPRWRSATSCVPGDEDLPSFSRLGCVAHVDRLLDFMPDDDLRGLQGVLSAASFLPRLLIAGLLRWLEAGLWPPGPWAAPLRVVRMSLRGIVLRSTTRATPAPSYDGPGPLDVLSYRVAVAVEDGRPAGARNRDGAVASWEIESTRRRCSGSPPSAAGRRLRPDDGRTPWRRVPCRLHETQCASGSLSRRSGVAMLGETPGGPNLMNRRSFLAAAAAVAGSTTPAPAAEGGRRSATRRSARPTPARSSTTRRSSPSSATSSRSASRSAGTAPAPRRR